MKKSETIPTFYNIESDYDLKKKVDIFIMKQNPIVYQAEPYFNFIPLTSLK